MADEPLASATGGTASSTGESHSSFPGLTCVALNTDAIRDLGKRLEKEQGPDDVKHIKKICLMSNACAAVGLAVGGGQAARTRDCGVL